jgi:hypothetical protein
MCSQSELLGVLVLAIQRFEAVAASSMSFEIEIEQEQEKGSVGQSIEEPRTHSIAASPRGKVYRKESNVGEQREGQVRHLAIGREKRGPATPTDAAAEEIGINHNIEERGVEDGYDLQRLRELQPGVTDEDDRDAMEYVEESEGFLAEDPYDGVEELVVLCEVEDVGPEENSTRGARAQGETQHPLCGALKLPTPNPSCLSDLHRRGFPTAHEDGHRSHDHAEVMNGGNRPQRQRALPVYENNLEKQNE